MYTFTSDQFGPSDRVVYQTVGLRFVQTIEGLVLIGHGSDVGTTNIPEALLKKADFIVVCHPAKVKAMYPKYAHKVVGDWQSKTGIRYEYVDGIAFITVLPQ